MPSYTAPIEDMMFLFEKLRNNQKYNELEKYKEVTSDLVKDILQEAAKINQNLILPLAKAGEMRAMYEPIHGSAPDIAGKGIANPIATILSFAMALRYSLDLDKEAEALEKAVQIVLNKGLRTKDILSKGTREVSTSEMGDAIISKLQ